MKPLGLVIISKNTKSTISKTEGILDETYEPCVMCVHTVCVVFLCITYMQIVLCVFVQSFVFIEFIDLTGLLNIM